MLVGFASEKRLHFVCNRDVRRQFLWLPECIIWLDNVDSLCDTADEFKSCEDFLNEITSLLHKEDASQVSFYQ